MEAAGVEAAMAVYGGGGRVTTDVKATAIMDQLNGLEAGRWRPPGQSLVTWSVAAIYQINQEPRHCYLRSQYFPLTSF